MRVSNFGIFARKRTNMLASQGENARLDTKMRTGRRKYARTHTEMRARPKLVHFKPARRYR
jgi:hypothetical protein